MIPRFYNRGQWLEMRRHGIGASEVGTVMGLCPYDSRYALWLRKTGRAPEKEETIAMRAGLAMEDFIADEFGRETGIVTTKPGDGKYAVWSYGKQRLSATPDRLAFMGGREIPVELKNVGLRQAAEWGVTAEIESEELYGEIVAPVWYKAQVAAQMACLDAPFGYLVGLIGNQRLTICRIERDAAFEAVMLKEISEFWEHVTNDTPPEIDGSDATTQALKRLHPDDNGAEIMLPDAADDWVEKLDAAKAEIKKQEGIKAEIENRIKAVIGDNTFGRYENIVFSWKTQQTQDHMVKGSKFRVLRIKREKA